MAKLFACAILLTLLLVAESAKKPGKNGKGKLSQKKMADDKVRSMLAQADVDLGIHERVCELLDGKCNKELPITAQAYREQMADGNNYFVAVEADNQIFHIRLLEPSNNGSVLLLGVKGPKAKADRIVPF